MIVRVQTVLDASPKRVWATVKRSGTLVHVARGMLAFRGAETFPVEWQPGTRVNVRLVFIHVLPAWWQHELLVKRIDETQREIQTCEGGGPIRVWNHSIRVAARPQGGSLYTDEIEIEAGMLTWMVGLFAHIFYRHRQSRWRRLATGLA